MMPSSNQDRTRIFSEHTQKDTQNAQKISVAAHDVGQEQLGSSVTLKCNLMKMRVTAQDTGQFSGPLGTGKWIIRFHTGQPMTASLSDY